MVFKPFEEIVGPITVTIRGKDYTLPDVSLADGVRIHRMGTEGAEDTTFGDLYRIILGPLQDELDADGIPAGTIERLFYTGLADVRGGRDAAEYLWEHGVPKEALNQIKEAAVAQAQTTPQAAESTTKPPASGSGTKNRTAAKSVGKKSSPTGP
jgi:hypothetical protein